jgi:hypothetical protein
MKEGEVTAVGNIPDEQELKAINRLSRRNLSADEVFVFSVVLCDNEIDRDFERFSDKALETMAKLYVGKTGIFDHSMKGQDQIARIFSCEVERPVGQTTSYGMPYVRLKARAYMPKIEKNRDIIAEIDAGIKKEVSVGCAVGKTVCSVCGVDRKREECNHQKGRVYHRKGKDLTCHWVLEDPSDVYEWSFVAVPAQRGAGVVKAFSCQKEEKSTLEKALDAKAIVKGLSRGKEMTLSADEVRNLSVYVTELEKSAEAGREHHRAMMEETLRLAALVQPDCERELMEKMIGGLEYGELCRMQKAYAKQLDRIMPTRSQFEQKEQTPKNHLGNHDFLI